MGVSVGNLDKFSDFKLPLSNISSLNNKNKITSTDTSQKKGTLSALKDRFSTKPSNGNHQNAFNNIHGNAELEKLQKQQQQMQKQQQKLQNFQMVSQIFMQGFQNMQQTSQQLAEVGIHGARGVAAAAA